MFYIIWALDESDSFSNMMQSPGERVKEENALSLTGGRQHLPIPTELDVEDATR